MLRGMARIVGLTGGIGTGKSTVARLFAALGAVVIDADAIVHELQARRMPMVGELAKAFGPDVLQPDGSLDRAQLGRIVFADAQARERLSSLVQPAVAREMAHRLQRALTGSAPLIVLDIPLLFEGRARRAARARDLVSSRGPAAAELVTETIVVYASPHQQLARQLSRDGITEEHARERMAAQLPIEEKRRLADHVIDNAGPLEQTERQVRELFARLTRA